MQIKKLTDELSISDQVQPRDFASIKAAGFRSVICNRPDGEGADQPTFDELELAADAAGIQVRYQPIVPGKANDQDVSNFSVICDGLNKPTLAFCRTGTRSVTLWALSESRKRPIDAVVATASAAGIDISGVARRVASGGTTPTNVGDASFDVVIVGGGAAGISVAASLQKRQSSLNIAIIDPADTHYYQPGWTMVGAGIFSAASTAKTMGALIPRGVHWIKSAVASFEPKDDAVVLDGCRVVKYKRLIVCPGLKLDWHKVEGLVETLGQNGVTSNYRYDLAPYTWQLVQRMQVGRAVFTQPPMPIKCAGAPQKVMYLSCDHWNRNGSLGNIDVGFYNAGGVLFGVKDYVPALMEYIERYDAKLNFFNNLVAVDGQARKAWFEVSEPDKEKRRVAVDFDMLHVCPPQTAPDFIRVSPLADAAGWVDVDQATLRHKSYDNIWSLGDVMNAPNAKTAAAARKQAPVVAENVIADIRNGSIVSHYDGYGSCPLTVERGKIVLAEFGYGGKLLPSFPDWLINGKRPTRLAWVLKEQILPPIYWKAMLRGKEWLAKPEKVTVAKPPAA
ncbi:MAG: TIGR01244 family phosphatase [Alphaproteobacteria bacterium]|nr:TIGR01244 family phosphatase [Alphaproteobacteria bacterium]